MSKIVLKWIKLLESSPPHASVRSINRKEKKTTNKQHLQLHAGSLGKMKNLPIFIIL